MRVMGLDHVVVICSDVEASLEFYVGVLGLESTDAHHMMLEMERAEAVEDES